MHFNLQIPKTFFSNANSGGNGSKKKAVILTTMTTTTTATIYLLTDSHLTVHFTDYIIGAIEKKKK